MPNRLLRDGICTSDLIEALTSDEEVFFYRLLVICDDFGHADARPAILKANCFPLKESATPSKIGGWLDGLVNAGLVRMYTSKDKPYLAILKWEQRVRTHPKHPLPDDDGSAWSDSRLPQSGSSQSADCGQVAAVRGLGKGKGKGKGAALNPLPDDWVPSELSIAWCNREFGLRVPEDIDRYVVAFRDACKARGYVYADFDAAFKNCVRQDWPKFRAGKARMSEERRVAV
jgi:hypothetical protein